jgi:hypothetical protein
MTGEYWAELENNHHYIIVDTEHQRTYYCPAEEASNTLSHILNDKNKTIRRLRKELEVLKRVKIYEIRRKLDNETCHVAFVGSEEFAWEFCNEHKDCIYGPVPITKYRLELETARANVPTCENCKHYIDFKLNSLCGITEELTNPNEHCEYWEMEDD